MAQKLQVLLTCDLHDGAVDAVETVTFAYDGITYAFELCHEHLRDFRAAMETWTSSARRTTEAPPSRPTVRPGPVGDTIVIREWAREAGFDVSERGRISSEVRAAYDAAHQG